MFAFVFLMTRILGQAIFVSFVFAIVLIANRRYVVNKRKTKYPILADENHFSNSLLLLVAAIIRTDKKTEDSEYRYIEQALLEHFPPKRVIRHLKFIKKHVEDTPIDYKGICRNIRFNFNLSSKIQLMHLLIGIAAADGMLMKTEAALLKDIAIQIRIPKATYDSLFKMFHFRHEGYYEQKQKRKSYSSKLRLAEAYEILELDTNATVKQIKKAYRKMALKHHPDRLIHLGKEYQKSAKEKFQIISDAYEYIKDRKGFS
jgi:DnaJ like chaperone protein